MPDPPTCQQSGTPSAFVSVSSDGLASMSPGGAVGSGPHTGGASPPPITWCTVCTETPSPAWPWSQSR